MLTTLPTASRPCEIRASRVLVKAGQQCVTSHLVAKSPTPLAADAGVRN